MNPDQIIDNQTKRVLYICCCFIFALLYVYLLISLLLGMLIIVIRCVLYVFYM